MTIRTETQFEGVDFKELVQKEYFEKCYTVAIGYNDKIVAAYSEKLVELFKSEYDHLKWEMYEGTECIYDVDEAERVKRIYLFKYQVWITAEYDYLEWETHKGRHYINDVNKTGIIYLVKRIYLFKYQVWIATKYERLKWSICEEEDLIMDADICTIKRIYVVDRNEWLVAEYDQLVMEVVQGRTFINDMEGFIRVKRKYVLHCNEWLSASYDCLKWIKYESTGYESIHDMEDDHSIRCLYTMKNGYKVTF